MPSAILKETKPDGPRRVPLTEEDVRKGSYSAPALQMALEGLHQDGMVVLKGVVDPEHCDILHKHMSGDRDRILRERHAGAKVYNQGVKSNILQAPPFTKPELLFEDVHFNPFVVQVMNAYLGANPKWIMSTGNNALAGTGGLRQPVHKDTRFRHPKCPFVIVANTALNDFTLENGATEFWLGSHAFTDERDQTIATPETVFGKQKVGTPSCPVLEEAVEARRAVRPPVRATMKKGDVMLRDFRTWHAGMPNATEQDRIMVAQIWMAPWYPNFVTRLNLPLSQAEWFQSRANKLPMEIMANYIADDAVEFDQHRDNFSMEPSHYVDYYDTAPQNYRYDWMEGSG
ncbi:hypothetical protein AYL99_10461 [Fonsecaea erecta]|uniref:Phytanoyl-CoA dioxygenase n=1 Tax=Fonsecaea erecta TaxID=1367422 RepID=A0A178Z6T3_9EURO|nr:hypothetical protein AYL99_10461 [Fonsecaea erecta]OAP55488.1 hypothetical protein AYL99_10461 [Fonsecaea erecta]